MVVNRKSSLRCRDAADERQYMLSGDYEVYEKVGEPVGAVSFHYHDFYELIYIIEGEFSSLIEDRAVRMRKGDFLLIDKKCHAQISSHGEENGFVPPDHFVDQ